MSALSPRLVLAGLGLALAVSGSAAAADLDGPYRGPRAGVERGFVGYRHGAFLPGHHFADRAYGLASIPLSVGPSGTYPYQVIGYRTTSCTPYSYRYFNGGCSPRGYGVY
jgi:hypothetical protein